MKHTPPKRHLGVQAITLVQHRVCYEIWCHEVTPGQIFGSNHNYFRGAMARHRMF